MKHQDNIKRWELALSLALCLTLLEAVFSPGGPGLAWWGVIFPGLTDSGAPEAVEAAKVYSAGGVQLRFQLLEWLQALLAG